MSDRALKAKLKRISLRKRGTGGRSMTSYLNAESYRYLATLAPCWFLNIWDILYLFDPKLSFCASAKSFDNFSRFVWQISWDLLRNMNYAQFFYSEDVLAFSDQFIQFQTPRNVLAFFMKWVLKANAFVMYKIYCGITWSGQFMFIKLIINLIWRVSFHCEKMF